MATVRCKGRKTTDKCERDGRCRWFNGECDMFPYDVFLRNRETKTGKPVLTAFATALGLAHQMTPKNTIAQICDLIVADVKARAAAEPDKTEAQIFNDVILAQSVAPIITEEQIEELQETSSSDVRKTLAFPMGNRVRFASYVEKRLAQLPSVESICNAGAGAIHVVRRIGSPSINGEAHLCELKYRNYTLLLASKRMPANTDSRHEIKYLTKFRDYVLNDVNPHFPLMYMSTNCAPCTYDNPDIKHKSSKCIYAINELANGDLKSWLNTPKPQTFGAIVSMFAQVVVGAATLEKLRLVHRDLHWGNVLYHSTRNYAGKFMHYTIGKHDVYVRNHGQLWVLWDFGMMSKAAKGETTVNTDLYRIANAGHWAANLHKLPMVKEASSFLNSMMQLALSGVPAIDVLADIAYYENDDTVFVDPQPPPPKAEIIGQKYILYM